MTDLEFLTCIGGPADGAEVPVPRGHSGARVPTVGDAVFTHSSAGVRMLAGCDVWYRVESFAWHGRKVRALVRPEDAAGWHGKLPVAVMEALDRLAADPAAELAPVSIIPGGHRTPIQLRPAPPRPKICQDCGDPADAHRAAAAGDPQSYGCRPGCLCLETRQKVLAQAAAPRSTVPQVPEPVLRPRRGWRRVLAVLAG